MIVIPVLAVLATCWHSFVILHGQWTDWDDTTHTHGYLIAAICIWLLWRERKALRASARFSWRRIWPLAIAMMSWLVAVMAGIQSVELVLLLPVLWCAIGAGLGWRAARSAVFPVGYLLFAIPIWGAFNGLFQWSSVYAVRAVLRLVGVPAYFDENFVQIPEGTFQIAGGCSGLHFVVVAAAIASLLGELRRDRLPGRIKLLAVAVGLAMLANWIRIVVIVEAGHLTNMQHYLVARSHYGFGWVVFGVCMTTLYWFESRMPVTNRHAAADQPQSPEQLRVATGWLDVTLGVVPMLGCFALWHLLAVRPTTAGLEVPLPPDGWSIQSGASSGWRPLLEGVDESGQQFHRRTDGATIDVFSGLYRWQGQGKEFTAYGNDLNPGNDLVLAYTAELGGTPFTLRQSRSAAGGEYLLASTYRVGQQHFANPMRAQLWYALSALLRFRSPASQVLLLHTACLPDCSAALNVLRDWKEGS